MNAKCNGSILSKITLPIRPYKILLNDANGHDYYFFKCYYYNLWTIHVQSPLHLPRSMWKFIFNITDVIFQFGSPKRKTTKFIWIMPHAKLSNAYTFGTRKLINKQKLQLIWTYENMVKF
jgi:hypothetical protein